MPTHRDCGNGELDAFWPEWWIFTGKVGGMARILCITSALRVHFNARFALIQELVSRGHTVGALFSAGDGPPAMVERLAALGVEHVPFGATPTFRPQPSAEQIKLLSQGEHGAARRAERYRRSFIDRNDVDAYRTSMRQFAPDVVCADPFDYDAIIAASLEGHRQVGIHAGLTLAVPPGIACGLAEADAELAHDRAAKFRRFGVDVPEFRYMAAVLPALNIVWTTRALVGDVRLPPRTELVGPCLPRGERFGDEVEFDWSALSDDKPLVYVTAGTSYYWQPDYFRDVAEAAADLRVQLIFAVMGLDQASYPGDVIVRSYVPQLPVMERITACVSHGGAITLMDAMYYGRPCLIVPFASDQPVQAHLVESTGVGIRILPEQLSPARIREALEQLIAPDSPQRAGAARVQESYRRERGAARAADLVVELSG